MEDILKFSETENKTRKRWLFLSTILPAVFIFGCLIITAIYNAFFARDFAVVGWILLGSLFLVGGFYINYHCAYKNPGTILLLLLMIGIPLNLLVDFLKPGTFALMRESKVRLLTELMIVFFELVVFYYSYNLRKINKKMRERKLLASPVYVNALTVLSTATNIEELNEQFTKLRSSHNSENSAVLAKAYYNQKKMLQLAK